MRHIKLTQKNLKNINTNRLYKRLFEMRELTAAIRKELRDRDIEINRVIK
jgi:hypothetical protein